MFRLPPSQIELTRKEVLDFLDRHKKRSDTRRQISAETWAQYQLQEANLARQPVPRLYRGAERSRDDSLTDTSFVGSSPSAAMNDRDEFELGDVEGYTSEADVSDPNSLAGHVYAQSIRRDSAMSQEMRVAVDRKPPEILASDLVGSLQLDGASSSTQQRLSRQPGSVRPSPSQPRHSRLRSSSDPGEPPPFSVQRYRPRLAFGRANTTNDLFLEANADMARASHRSVLHTVASDISDDSIGDYDASRRPAAHHVVYYRQSPLEELATGAARLNLQSSLDCSRRSPSSLAQFPTFEDNSTGSASNASEPSMLHTQHPGPQHPSASSPNLPEPSIASPSAPSAVPESPSPSAAERLRAFADSFSPFLRRISPQRRQARQSAVPVVAPPRYSLATSTGPDWSPANPSAQSSRPRLTELAVGRTGVASPMHFSRLSITRRTVLDEEQENNEDMAEVEEEARLWRQRIAEASMQQDGSDSRDDRTPPRQGRFLSRFLG